MVCAADFLFIFWGEKFSTRIVECGPDGQIRVKECKAVMSNMLF